MVLMVPFWITTFTLAVDIDDLSEPQPAVLNDLN